MENPAQRHNINNNNTIYFVSFGIGLTIYLVSSYLLITNEGICNNTVSSIAENTESTSEASIKNDSTVKAIKRVVIIQPTSPKSYLYTELLPQLIVDLKIEKECCTPEDLHNEEKHKIPKMASKTNKSEPEGVMVVYIAVGLLLMSLGAALLDFFRAKSEMKRDQADGKKKPSTVPRNCSLADLTVLRHKRKELRRKESFSEAPKTSWKVNRPQLRLEDS